MALGARRASDRRLLRPFRPLPVPKTVIDPSIDFSRAHMCVRAVLFMPVDDMRPMMNKAYNFSLAHTPHLDQLASEGLTFTRAYVQYAYCSPSRNSFMTGRRPDTTRVWEFVDHFREEGVGANWTSLPQYFKRHGYITLG